MDIVILKPLTAAEQAQMQAERVVFHLNMANSYCANEAWGKAQLALRDASRALQRLEMPEIEVTDIDLLRKITAGFPKIRNRLRHRI